MDQDLISRFREYMFLQAKWEEGGLSIADNQRWEQLKAALNRHFQPEAQERPVDLRKSVRVPARLRLRYESLGAVAASLLTNVSRGGIFVATNSPLPIGSKVKLWIEVEDLGSEIELEGEVASQNASPDLANEERGMGLRFCNLDDATRKLVGDLYERCANRAIEQG